MGVRRDPRRDSGLILCRSVVGPWGGVRLVVSIIDWSCVRRPLPMPFVARILSTVRGGLGRLLYALSGVEFETKFCHTCVGR